MHLAPHSSNVVTLASTDTLCASGSFTPRSRKKPSAAIVIAVATLPPAQSRTTF
jgi:hypothetical protein